MKYAFMSAIDASGRSRPYAKCWKSVPADIINAGNAPRRSSRTEAA